MKQKRPLIGITAWHDYDNGSTYIKRGYIEGINKVGGLAVLLPGTLDDRVVSEYIERCDGFLLSGGADIDAKFFGERNLPFNGELSPYRDHMEIIITRKAVENNKPLFGICRGIQIMNVAMGGNIYQDISSQIKDRQLLKHEQDAPKWYPTHKIHIDRNSKLMQCLKSEEIEVNSFHHQAVKDVAHGFKVTASSEDGVIEAIEYTGHKFALGVQWHPEVMWQENNLFLNLFEEFVQGCKKHMTVGKAPYMW